MIKNKARDGIGHEISNVEYHNSDILSVSKIKQFITSPCSYYHKYVAKDVVQKKTPALQIGDIAHALAMDDPNFDDNFLIQSDGKKENIIEMIKKLGGEIEYRQLKNGNETTVKAVAELKADLDALTDRHKVQIITEETLEKAATVAEKIRTATYNFENEYGDIVFSAKIGELTELDRCYVERVFYGTIGGQEFQVRPDLLLNVGKHEPKWIIIDIKTAEDSSADNFRKSCSKYYYDLQQLIYPEILRQNDIEVLDFVFCVGGKQEDSGVEFYTISQFSLGEAKSILQRSLLKLKYCQENDIWRDGYFDLESKRFSSKTTLNIPAYRNLALIESGVA